MSLLTLSGVSNTNALKMMINENKATELDLRLDAVDSHLEYGMYAVSIYMRILRYFYQNSD